jgi:hypothetical protein
MAKPKRQKTELEDILFMIDASTLGNSRAIDKQELRGQKELIDSAVLPKRISDGERAILETYGIIFGEDVDDLFVNVVLPQGWTKVATEHSMWSNLVDDKGRERASIFYKAAFYDRDAFIRLSRRFSVHSGSIEGFNSGLPYEQQHHIGIVKDCGVEIFRTEGLKETPDVPWYAICDIVEHFAREWLNKHYPDWEQYDAYWD